MVLSTWLVVYSFISSSSMKMQSGMRHPSDSVSYCKYIILFKTDVSGADFRDRAVSYRKVFGRISYLVLIYSRVCGRIRVERTRVANHEHFIEHIPRKCSFLIIISSHQQVDQGPHKVLDLICYDLYCLSLPTSAKGIKRAGSHLGSAEADVRRGSSRVPELLELGATTARVSVRQCLLRLTVNIFSSLLTKLLKINYHCFKKLKINFHCCKNFHRKK